MPDARTPMFIVYKKGDIRNQIVGWGADRERRIEGELSTYFSVLVSHQLIVKPQSWKRCCWSRTPSTLLSVVKVVSAETTAQTTTRKMPIPHLGCDRRLPLPMGEPKRTLEGGETPKTTTTTRTLTLTCNTVGTPCTLFDCIGSRLLYLGCDRNNNQMVSARPP